MVLEIIVAAACLEGRCSDAVGSYYVYNPAFKDRSEEILSSIDRQFSAGVKEYVLPTANFLFKKQASYDLNTDTKLVLDMNNNNTILGLSYRY